MTAVIAALAVLAAESGSDAGTAKDASRVRITVRAIAATGGAEWTDPKLAPIAPNLAEFAKDFRWRNFRLLSEDTFALAYQSAAQMELPGSRSVQVTPRQLSPDAPLKVHRQLLPQHPSHAPKPHTHSTTQPAGP